MAQKVNIILVDDLDGSEAEETVTFGLDGSQYEIDLNSKNAEAMREALAPFVDSARRVAARRGRPPKAATNNGTPTTTATAKGTKRGGTRKRVATVEQIEAGKK